MERIEIDVITGERKVIPLTSQEIAEAQQRYQEWIASQPTKEEQIAELQAKIAAIQGTE